jgi:hypothetical protein
MSTYRYYQCIANTTPAAAKGPLWDCFRLTPEDTRLDTDGLFTGIRLKKNIQGTEGLAAYDVIRKFGCLAPFMRPTEVRAGVKGLTTLHVGVKSWVPDSLDVLLVAGNLPGGILLHSKGT